MRVVSPFAWPADTISNGADIELELNELSYRIETIGESVSRVHMPNVGHADFIKLHCDKSASGWRVSIIDSNISSQSQRNQLTKIFCEIEGINND